MDGVALQAIFGSLDLAVRLNTVVESDATSLNGANTVLASREHAGGGLGPACTRTAPCLTVMFVEVLMLLNPQPPDTAAVRLT